MNRKRIGFCVLLSGAVLLAATEPVLAQSVNAELINELNAKLLYIAVPITVLVEGILIYAVWKFKDNDDANPTRENRRLEITWTLATAVILLFVGLGAFLILGNPYIALVPDAAPGGQSQPQAQQRIQPSVSMDKPGAVAPPGNNVTEVEVIGEQWSWTFNYPGNVSTTGTLMLPAHTDIYLHTISTDVIHAIHVPALGLKQDSFPGQYNTLKTNISNPGTYQLYCAEFCGSGHSRMLANVTVMPQDEYQSWLDEQQAGGNTTNGSAANSSAMAPVRPA